MVIKHREQDHEFDWDNVKILDRETNFYKLCISEMLHIKSTEHTLNSQNDTQKLNHKYNTVFPIEYKNISRKKTNARVL